MAGPTAPRDRDERGRPKSKRPRDALGRPQPREAANALEEVPAPSTPDEALVLGIENFNAGLFFQAHEIWEEPWHAAPAQEGDFWQGLIQVAVGLTHRQRGNAHGAATLLRRGARRLRGYGDLHRGVPCAQIAAFAEAAAAAIESDGLDAPLDIPKIPRP